MGRKRARRTGILLATSVLLSVFGCGRLSFQGQPARDAGPLPDGGQRVDAQAGCTGPTDCESRVCRGGQCLEARCDDSVLNGGETDIDCGGFDCDPCGAGRGSAAHPDCSSGECLSDGTCAADASCSDGRLSGDETDVDSGGSCEGCDDGRLCSEASDCASLVCDGTCAPSACDDEVQKGDETDVDCGGSACAPCGDASSCSAPGDCISGVCTEGSCTPASCSDSIRNGSESDVDCGGSCSACADLGSCGGPADCTTGVCSGGTCQTPSCSDSVQNGSETDVDCGGSCSACSPGEMCGGPADCTTSVCSGGVCQSASCSDSVRNGSETDVDCGGSCSGCAAGENCNNGGDCESGTCSGGTCGAPPIPGCNRELYGGHRYELCPLSHPNHETAEAFCTSNGGHLAKFETLAEAQALIAYSATQGIQNVRIGLNDRTTEGTYVWHDGSALTFSFWQAGDPNGGTHENCAIFNYAVQSGRFISAPCNWTWPTLCEME